MRSHQYLSNGDKQHLPLSRRYKWALINFLEIIESEDNLKLYASEWEVDNDGEMVLTRNGKVITSKEPLSMLLRLIVNSLD